MMNQLPQLLKIESNSKIAIFSDIHWGISKDSDVKLNISIAYIDWLISYCKSNNINTILFLGDWFNNRSAISVKTSNIAYEAVKKISNANLKLYIIVGNHDLYYKETENNVNSIQQYSEIRNIYVIQDTTKLEFINQDKSAICLPYGKSYTESEKFDYCFGHFDFAGALMTGSYMSNSSANSDSFTSLAKLVFDGHFHINNTYKYESGNIICIGSPFELDWGDYENQKYLTVLDLKYDTIEKVINDFSPLHIKVYWSRLKQKQEKLTNIKGNYIKFIIDAEYNFQQITKILTLINQCKPLKQCECEFVYNTKFENPLTTIQKIETVENKNLSILDYFENFLILHKESTKFLDSAKLKDLIEKYYQEAVNEQGE